jgi:sugar phosphate isomerase/epimerase
MSQTPPLPVDRRAFLRGLAGLGGAALATAYALPAWAESLESGANGLLLPQAWRDQIGLQLFTVRDRFPADYAGTLEAVAKIGYKQVQPTMNYGGKTPAEVKAILDKNGLTAPATHVSPQNGPDFEKTLDGYAAMGHKYTTVNVGGEGRGRGAGAGAGAGGAAPASAPGAAVATGASAASGAAAATAPMPQRPAAPAQTLDSVKRTADALNAAGRITQKHGIKVIVHNHTVEFAPLADSSQRPYDVLLAETDPSLVAMELDIGWATVAGADPLALFKQAPGRFEAWHVKDMKGLAALAGKSMSERQRAAQIVPVGEGEIDYKSIFAQARLAGMKYFFVEQDSAPQSGDSLAAAATSYRALSSLLA